MELLSGRRDLLLEGGNLQLVGVGFVSPRLLTLLAIPAPRLHPILHEALVLRQLLLQRLHRHQQRVCALAGQVHGAEHAVRSGALAALAAGFRHLRCGVVGRVCPRTLATVGRHRPAAHAASCCWDTAGASSSARSVVHHVVGRLANRERIAPEVGVCRVGARAARRAGGGAAPSP